MWLDQDRGLWSQEERVPQAAESLADAPEDRDWLALRGAAWEVRGDTGRSKCQPEAEGGTDGQQAL